MRLLPTYRLEPMRKFNKEKCEQMMKALVDASLVEFEYESTAAATMATNLSDAILLRVKNLNFDRYEKHNLIYLHSAIMNNNYHYSSSSSSSPPLSPLSILESMNVLDSIEHYNLLNFIRRFKFVCNVTLVENSMQGFCAMYRCLWDKKFDKTAIYVYETPNLYAIATVHGLYFD